MGFILAFAEDLVPCGTPWHKSEQHPLETVRSQVYAFAVGTSNDRVQRKLYGHYDLKQTIENFWGIYHLKLKGFKEKSYQN